jgi:transposase-like protein
VRISGGRERTDGCGERAAAAGEGAERGRVPAAVRQREAQCRAALFQLRWGKGWVCPACGHGRCAELKTRALYSCNRCKHQVGLTAGTVFHWTKLPLTTWFLAIYHLTQSKGGMSSVERARRLGTRQPTAWLMKQKLMAAMEQRDAGKPRLQGRVEVDDAYLGGAHPGGKRGRGAAGKTPFVAAVETTAARKPRRLRLTVV